MVSPQLTSDILGYLGGSLLAIQLIPQIIKVWKTYSSKDLSYGTLFLNISGGSMIIAYGILISQPPVYATVCCSLGCNITLLCTKIFIEKPFCNDTKINNDSHRSSDFDPV